MTRINSSRPVRPITRNDRLPNHAKKAHAEEVSAKEELPRRRLIAPELKPKPTGFFSRLATFFSENRKPVAAVMLGASAVSAVNGFANNVALKAPDIKHDSLDEKIAEQDTTEAEKIAHRLLFCNESHIHARAMPGAPIAATQESSIYDFNTGLTKAEQAQLYTWRCKNDVACRFQRIEHRFWPSRVNP